MKLIVLVGFVILTAGVIAQVTRSALRDACKTGEVKAFVAIRSDPQYLVGTIPSRFTDSAGYFAARYSCTNRPPEVRRVDEGLYEVRLPGLRPKVALATAISEEGVSTSAYPFGNTVRVALRGPLSGEPIARRRDVAFSIAVY